MNTYLSGWRKQILPGHVFLECNLEALLTYNSKTNSIAKIQGDEALVEKTHWNRELLEVDKSVSRKTRLLLNEGSLCFWSWSKELRKEVKDYFASYRIWSTVRVPIISKGWCHLFHWLHTSSHNRKQYKFCKLWCKCIEHPYTYIYMYAYTYAHNSFGLIYRFCYSSVRKYLKSISLLSNELRNARMERT